MRDQGNGPETGLRRYHVVRELASGGMASIHLARTAVGGDVAKLVALKRIHDHLEREPEHAAMFADEARLGARIDHPNVCRVLDFGMEAGERYIALEYLSGETVAQLVATVAQRPWAPEWPFLAAHLVALAAEGLHAAHELHDAHGRPDGVVHGDVAPNNLLVTYGGELKVLDFGIARGAAATRNLVDAAHRAAPGARGARPIVPGKAAYLAPEQLAGRALDRRTDVWALGVTLWEMLALEPLFHRSGDTCATMGAVASFPIPSPSSLRRRVPSTLDAVVMRALERDPRARFATARDLGRALASACREHVETFDAVDLEEFMADLFPVERWRKRTMERDALATRDTSGLLRVAGQADSGRGSRQAAS